MKPIINLVIILAFLFKTAKSQNASFTVRIDGKTVTTFNTSNLTSTPTDSFSAIWQFNGAGRLLFQSFDSASYTFLTGGSYLVGLTVNHFVKTSENPNNWRLKLDTNQFFDTIVIGSGDNFTFAGKVFWRGQPVNKANVHLLKKDNGRYNFVRTSIVNELGEFSIDNLTSDTFVIWTQPIICDTCIINSMNVLPTYSGNTSILDSATSFIPIGDTSNYAINLLEPSPLIGNLLVSGRILNSSSPRSTSLLLLDNDKSKTFRFVNSNLINGEYSINNIAPGSYLLQPIVDGIPFNPVPITISQNASLDINLTPLTTSVTENESKFDDLNIYPNPFVDRILIQTESESSIESIKVMDIQGKIVFQEKYQLNKEIDLSNLENGLYLFRIESDNRNSKTIKIIKN